MKKLLMVLFLALTPALTLGCGDDESTAETPPPGATVFTLTAEGGTFDGQGELAGVRLTVPADAVSAPTELWMAPPETLPPPPSGGVLVGLEVEFGPGDPMLAAPAQLTLPFEMTRVMQAGAALQFVKVWRFGPDGWVLEEPSMFPTEEGVTISTTDLGHFGAGVETE